MNQTTIDEFKAKLRGELIQHGDASYDEACKVYNGMIQRRPLMIARCTDAADVIASVNFGRENKLLMAVRGGGHNGGGLGTCDGGLVIDLSGIRYVRVDPMEKTVRAGGGCLLGDVDHATYQFGLATPSGTFSTTGVGGITLGGGIGHLTRNFGLSIDNLIEADVVLADGSFVKASAGENPDLFWAIRGGGGNFGVVTSFLFKLHPVKNVVAGPTFWDIEKTAEVMKFYRDFMPKAPQELNGFFAFLVVPPVPLFPEALHNKKMCAVVWCYSGDESKADKIFEPIKNFGPPALYGVHSLPFPALQSVFDALYPPGLQWYWKAHFVDELTDKAIEQHVKFGNGLPTPYSSMHLYPIDAVASKVKNSDTAWGFRNSKWSQVIIGVDPDPANKDKITSWAKDYWQAMLPYSAKGFYTNFSMDDTEDRIKASFGDNFQRLTSIKKKYDPNNLFRVNQNIKPA